MANLSNDGDIGALAAVAALCIWLMLMSATIHTDITAQERECARKPTTACAAIVNKKQRFGVMRGGD